MGRNARPGFFRYPMSKACPNKVTLLKGKMICSGQHFVQFEDGTTSWGSEHPKRYPIEKILHKFIISNGIILY